MHQPKRIPRTSPLYLNLSSWNVLAVTAISIALGGCCVGMFEPDCHPNCICTYWVQPQLRRMEVITDTVNVTLAEGTVEFEVEMVAGEQSHRDNNGEVSLSGKRVGAISEVVAVVTAESETNSFPVYGTGIEEYVFMGGTFNDTLVTVWHFDIPVGAAAGARMVSSLSVTYYTELCEMETYYIAEHSFPITTSNEFVVVNLDTLR